MSLIPLYFNNLEISEGLLFKMSNILKYFNIYKISVDESQSQLMECHTLIGNIFVLFPRVMENYNSSYYMVYYIL